MRMSRLRSFGVILAWLPALACADARLPAARDLHDDGKHLRARRMPMLVLYSQANCHWCERVKREYLLPMQRDPQYQGRVLQRQIDIDRDSPLTDFGGVRTTHRSFAQFEGVSVTPTLVVYGPDGARLADAIVGFRTPDFYGTYIERAIAEGSAAMLKETQ